MNKKSKQYSEANQMNLRVVVGLYRSYFRLNRNTQKLMAAYGLTVAQFGVLEALYHLGDLKIGEIIEKTLSTSGNMTVVIKNLEQDGWVSRRSDPEDRRACFVCITERGQALLEEIFPVHLTDLDKTLENLAAAEKEQLSMLLKKLNGV
ncbi:MarR family transcriptional regulator [Azotosporobacter soli]|uniref:MarR family winged helix-turn-helix transcriptional regulator n=1 Tax=Azotosporobacter soli TaxID=3055040 RepID=UPI0031FE8DC8